MSIAFPHLLGADLLADREPLVGSVAPSFQMRDADGNNVTLRRLNRQQPVLLYLYRGGW